MKILLSIVSVCLLLFFPQTVLSQTGKFEKGLLWEVTGNDLEKPSYILGTHHLVHVDFVDSIPNLRYVMDNVEQTVGEVVLSPEELKQMQQKVMSAVMMPEGKSYSSILSEGDYNILNTRLTQKMNMGLDQLGRLIPSMIGQMYVVIVYRELDPSFDPQKHKAIDDYIQQVSRENGKLVLGLESVEDQIYAIYTSDSIEQQAEDLLCQVVNSEFSVKSLRMLNEYYEQGELGKICDLWYNNPDDPCQPTQEQRDRMNKDRNDKWIQKLPAIMKDKSSLVVVGALHLAGEDGILSQLDKIGYSVTRVE